MCSINKNIIKFYRNINNNLINVITFFSHYQNNSFISIYKAIDIIYFNFKKAFDSVTTRKT